MRVPGPSQFGEDEDQTSVGPIEVNPGVGVRCRRWSLEQVQGPGAPRLVVLERAELVVGRSCDADLQVDSSLISRRHLVMRRRGPEYEMEDLRSSNGVYLNGVRAHSAVLREGDLLQVGDAVFIYHEGR
jgi:pSer/pThr/pTyr-binding forkhead associated (FHA) protein